MKINNKKLIIIRDKETNGDINYSYPFIDILHTNHVPSIISLLTTNNKYIFHKKYKKQSKFIYRIAKFLGKIWSYKDEIKNLLLLQNYNFNTLIIYNHAIIQNIFGFHLNQKVNIFSAVIPQATNQIKFSRHIYLLILSAFIQIKLIKTNNQRVLILLFNCTDFVFAKFIRKLFPNATIMNRFVDDFSSPLLKIYDILNFYKKMSHLNIKIESYSQKLCQYNNFIFYQPNLVSFKKLKHISSRFKTNTSITSAFLVAGGSKGRFERIINLAKNLIQYNIVCEFYITQLDSKQSEQALYLNKINPNIKIHPNQGFSYSEYINNFVKANLIIDIFSLYPEEGYSYRIPECLAINKKLITDRYIIREEPFYCENNIFIIEEIFNHEKFQLFLQAKTLPYKNIDIFNMDIYFKTLLENNN